MARIPYPVPEGTKMLCVHPGNFVRASDDQNNVICDIYKGDDNPFIVHDARTSLAWYCRYQDRMDVYDRQLKYVRSFGMDKNGIILEDELNDAGLEAKTGFPLPSGAASFTVQKDCMIAFNENAEKICTIYNVADNPILMEHGEGPKNRTEIRWVSQYENKLECFDRDLNKLVEIGLDQYGQPDQQDMKKAELRLK